MAMAINTKRIAAGRFKDQCLALLDDVAAHKQTLVVTKRGRPVAKVVPIEEPKQIEGSVLAWNTTDDEPAISAEDWDMTS
ncbi:MAG: hypothetical protein A2341_09540 [Deltaproteobacteria bacterium RIFOXYB12_FULL_58_9]|nr:MAG: hypothetical protein A2341_09540 [Deltaproteobacteria bacterium RIFOXYB12_FULL_58_9]